MAQKIQLNVDLAYIKGHGKVKTTTIGLIKFGPVVLATSRRLPGRYSGKQLLAECKRNRKNFRMTEDGAEILDALLQKVSDN